MLNSETWAGKRKKRKKKKMGMFGDTALTFIFWFQCNIIFCILAKILVKKLFVIMSLHVVSCYLFSVEACMIASLRVVSCYPYLMYLYVFSDVVESR
jgi:hypothetical protein